MIGAFVQAIADWGDKIVWLTFKDNLLWFIWRFWQQLTMLFQRIHSWSNQLLKERPELATATQHLRLDDEGNSFHEYIVMVQYENGWTLQEFSEEPQWLTPAVCINYITSYGYLLFFILSPMFNNKQLSLIVDMINNIYNRTYKNKIIKERRRLLHLIWNNSKHQVL